MKKKHLHDRLVMAVAVTALLLGCGKREEPAPSPASPEASTLRARASPSGAPKPDAPQTDGPVNLPAGVYPYPPNGVLVGQGWDTFNNTGTTGSCVKVDAARLEQASYSLAVEQVISSYSLLRTVQSSVSASYSGGGGSVKGSVAQSSSRQIKSDDQNILFNFESLDGSTFAVGPGSIKSAVASSESTLKLLTTTPNINERVVQMLLEQPQQFGGSTIRLTDDAVKLLATPDEFRRICGEGFVAAIHRGVRIQLLLTQSGASSEEKNSLSASLSASGYGASGRASYSQSKAEINTSDKLGYRIMQEGGIPMQPQAISVNNKKFDVNTILPKAEQMLANPTAFRVVVVPYANVDGRASGKLPTPLALMTIGDYYIALTDLYNLVRDIAASSKVDPKTAALTWVGVSQKLIDAYGGLPHLERLSDEILGDLAFLEGIIAECYRSRKACTVKEATASAKKEIGAAIALQMRALKLDSSDQSTQDKIDAKIRALVEQAKSPAMRSDMGAARQSAEELDDYRHLRTLQRLEESIVDDEPSLGFFLRFYWYLTQIPLPASVLAPDWTVPAAAEVEKKTQEINAAIVNAVVASRIAPWKSFFCEDLKSDALCVPDSWLRELTAQNSVKVDAAAIVVQPPPPPPSKKKCRWPKCWW